MKSTTARTRTLRRSSMSTIVAIALALVLALLLAVPASAAKPIEGSGPDQAIPLSGSVAGALAPGQVAWYSYWHDANLNDAITLKTTPTIDTSLTKSGDYATGAFFNVEWRGAITDSNFPGGDFEKDAAGLWRIGQSTQAGLEGTDATLPDGTQYWQQTKSFFSMPLLIEVVNQTASPISFALTRDQSNDAVSAHDNALPAPAPIAAKAAPEVAAVPNVTAVGWTMSNVEPLKGTVKDTLGPGQVAWYSYWHDANLNDAITLKTTPAMAMIPNSSGDYWGETGAYFNVQWVGGATANYGPNFPGGDFEKDAAGCWRIGQSTQSGLAGGGTLPDGTQYWQQGKSIFSMPLMIEVVNQSNSTISYALTLDQSNDAVSAHDNALPAPAP